MNPFSYSLAELSKALVAGIFLVGYVVLLFVTFDPTLIQSISLLVAPTFAVVAVFAAKNHTADDLQKALEQLKAAVITVVAYFTVVPASTENKIGMAIGALASFIGVYWARNRSTTT
jgi:hypothetical protein